MTVDDAAREEVSHSDYLKACRHLGVVAQALQSADADEAATHLLHQLVLQFAVIFNFVGANMTARHTPRYLRTLAEYEAAKDVTLQPRPGTLPEEPNTGGKDGGIADGPGGAGPRGAGPRDPGR